MDHIQNNTYPGRGIVVGKDTNNNSVLYIGLWAEV